MKYNGTSDIHELVCSSWSLQLNCFKKRLIVCKFK